MNRILHRANTGKHPENTLEALKDAVQADAEGIEIDVRLSSDGIPMVIHDSRLHKLTGHWDRVENMTAAEIKSLKVVSEDEKTEGTIPTLVEAIELVNGKKELYVELKSVWREDLQWVHLLKEPAIDKPLTIPLNGTDCHFYGFAFDSQLSKPPFDEFKRNDAAGFHVALIHGSLVDGSQFDMHNRNVPLDKKKLSESGMDYIALGHYHNFQEIDVNGVKIVYPGTLEGLRFGEDGERYLLVAELSENGISLKKESFNKRMLISEELNLNGAEDAAAAIRDKLSALASENNLLKLKLTGSTGRIPDSSAIRSAYEDQFFHLELKDEISIFGSEGIEMIRKEKTVRGAFVTKLTDDIENLDKRERKVRELALRKGLESLSGTG